MKICICGGGNLGHVMAGFIAAQEKYEVRLLTRKPELWSNTLTIETPSNEELVGHLQGIYGHAKDAVKGVDIVLLCLPGFSIREVLLQIKDCLDSYTAVGSVVSSTGFFFEAMKILPATTPLFGFQRVPFISRLQTYGHKARLMGYKESLNMAVERSKNAGLLRNTLSEMLKTHIHLLGSYYEASLSNSNPLLHPARLYSLWKDWHEGVFYSNFPLFYEEWTEEAAQLYLQMDCELHQLLGVLPVDPDSIPTVLDYYESKDVTSLAAKLRSIEAFKGIQAPMQKVESGYLPDFRSRYFTEDFPYGLAIVRQLAHKYRTPSSTIDRVYEWGMRMLDNSSRGADE